MLGGHAGRHLFGAVAAPQADLEEVTRLGGHFTAEEYAALDQRAMKSQPLSKQTAFTVAFVAAAMAPDTLRAVLAEAPLPFRVLYRLTRRSFARLEAQVFGPPVALAATAA